MQSSIESLTSDARLSSLSYVNLGHDTKLNARTVHDVVADGLTALKRSSGQNFPRSRRAGAKNAKSERQSIKVSSKYHQQRPTPCLPTGRASETGTMGDSQAHCRIFISSSPLGQLAQSDHAWPTAFCDWYRSATRQSTYSIHGTPLDRGGQPRILLLGSLRQKGQVAAIGA